MKILKVLLFFYLISVNFVIRSQSIKVRIFYDYRVQQFVFTPKNSYYFLYLDDSSTIKIPADEPLYFTILKDYIQIRSISELISTCRKLTLKPENPLSSFYIKTINPSLETRNYEGFLEVCANNNQIELINIIDFEKYIAGVVESEAGFTNQIEFYKTQAIICRTYAYAHLNRHLSEGFNLCDGIHCQVYKGKCQYYDNILPAVFETHHLIITDSLKNPINAAFHSNSGGQTANSEDVWLSSVYYLKSVDDPYSLPGKNAKWSKKISVDEWRNYLINQGFTIDYDNNEIFNFAQQKRMQYYKIGKDSISFKKIRVDWNLKSSFFSVINDGNVIIFEGRGYGHGVGLSQEGGIEMARQGKSFIDIINHYYKNVSIISIDN